MTETISVVMVSFHTGEALFESVAAVLRDDAIAELILVDNGNPPDHRRRFAQEFCGHDRVRLLQGHGNIGFARGSNYGASVARGDALLFLNPDAVIAQGAASELLAAVSPAGAKSSGLPWLAGGRLLRADGTEQRGSRRGRLTFASAFRSFTPLHKLPGLRSVHWEDDPLPNGPVTIPTVSGALMMMERAGFNAVGGFDPGYFLHVEDIALCRSVRAKGGSVIFVPDARAKHYGSTSEVALIAVEAHKLNGFLRYFWTSGGLGAKIGTILGAPLMAAAILGRALLLSMRR